MKANELKVTDLMIGDWLQDSFGNIGQVYRLDPGRVHLRLLQERPQDEEYIVHDIEPIQLTPEILEKNGFKMEFYSDYTVYELNNFKVCKSYCDYFEICDLWKDSDFGWEIISFCPCIYVHQLQHALKACGISKEIVI